MSFDDDGSSEEYYEHDDGAHYRHDDDDDGDEEDGTAFSSRSRDSLKSPMSSSGLSVSSRFGSSGSISHSPFPLHTTHKDRDANAEDHVVWKGTAVLVKIGSSTFSSVKCASEPMRCHVSTSFIWFIRSASRPSSGIQVLNLS